ncbi:putative DNA topoisomerase transcription factor interactor and regulator CCHC(Zn) family [Rosa chinensis]|uniref:Putative DNA topoisomerase transcription factor interactor and regulator CCHC(Zn) family n=1 Tax=Rosa chinensis TaxID=74649 RepID=A0A2P6S0Y2_ROSCH|nr:DNA-binding protein HEXBP [Rosa chinensis]PRQ52325.1 putative DNA topoisomerase transcription factor interactor and regulator CCHC(Zn) family [Rosa chinensis]
MKTEAPGFLIQIDDDVDDDFLSQVAAAEAHALANKRRRIATPTLSPNAVASAPPPPGAANPKERSDSEADGGLYIAALKGNQSAFSEPPRGGGFGRGRVGGAVAASGNDGVLGGDACFKCGKSGHWARDCDAPGGGRGGGGGGYNGNYGGGAYNGNYGGDAASAILFPEKSCPCGSGTCVVLTANTEKNRGRKFYKCPLRQENGGCGFFEWCDNASGPNAMAGAGSGSFSRTQNYASDSTFPALECPCGGGQCRILTAKTGKNIGSQFYRCPGNEGSSCGFFKWCNENTVAAGSVQGARIPKVVYGSSETGSQGSYGVRTGSSCYKCGKEGHWARDCSVPSNNAPVEFGGRSASTSSCYKCGKTGHWARDCPSG